MEFEKTSPQDEELDSAPPHVGGRNRKLYLYSRVERDEISISVHSRVARYHALRRPTWADITENCSETQESNVGGHNRTGHCDPDDSDHAVPTSEDARAQKAFAADIERRI